MHNTDHTMPQMDILINALPDFVSVKDGQGRWMKANTVALDIFHIPRDADYRGKKDSELAKYSPFYMKALQYCEETDEQVWQKGHTVRGAESIPQPDGSVRVFDTIKVPIFNEDKSRKLLIVIGRDVTEHVKANQELEYSQQRYKSLFQNSPHAVFSLDLNAKFTSINSKMEELCGYEAEELIDKPISMLVLEEFQQDIQHLFNSALKEPCPTVEICISAKNGRTFEVQIFMMPIDVNGEVIGAYGVLVDISDKKRNEQIIHHMAFYDTLTGLANRALLSRTINEAIDEQNETNSVLALLFIDLDNFKTWNDTKGHSVGDELLKQVAERLRECVRSSKDMICRLGGDEFIILLPEVESFSDASQVANRILDQFSQPWNIARESVFISASIGIAMAAINSQIDAESLIRNADIAMYEAKRKGKNTYRFFDEKLNDKIQHRFEIEKSLRHALDNDEFTLYYQPQVDAVTQKVTGAEALIRWSRPGAGIVPPEEFICIAEECGLIVPIGNWVLRETCKQIQEWSTKELPPFRVSINISPRQFQDERFVNHFRETLQSTGVGGERLCVEITESVIVPDIDYAQKTLVALREMGITIDIDDFGTGYSSFSYLMDFPIDRIKIDKSFVQDISRNKAAAIVKSIIALAKNLDIASIAEGVETQSQSEVLAFYGCNELQGYLIHEPVPASEFEQYIIKMTAPK